jgi:hypothetical protein
MVRDLNRSRALIFRWSEHVLRLDDRYIMLLLSKRPMNIFPLLIEYEAENPNFDVNLIQRILGVGRHGHPSELMKDKKKKTTDI